ncbi:hypothetical protein OUZ56_026378 [Daphnia magna]|uniref:Uncharacterized protein n=1 Tax=Daphnia magna TaxID=35525 RepID=A0ABQ9ZMK4_9CRUS|nr:hypothetical protein OUZ56_026378 [Daphnia magna]
MVCLAIPLFNLKILEESSDSISLSFGGTGKAVLLVKPFRLDVYDEDQLVLSVNAKLLYHHLHYSSMLPKLINFMIESINLKILEESSDSISLSFGGTGKVVLLVKPFRLDVYDEDQLVLSVNKGLLYHHLHYSSMLPKLINFMIESINIGGTDVRKESNTEDRRDKADEKRSREQDWGLFVVLGRQVKIADFLHYCLAPMEITSQVEARRKQFSDCDKNCAFKICHNPFNSGKGHDFLNKFLEHRYIVNSSSSRHATEKKRHLL